MSEDTESEYRVSIYTGCTRSLQKLPDRVSARFQVMMNKLMSDPSAKGLDFEPIQGARDRRLRSIRVDKQYRAIALKDGRDVVFLHVDDHDEAFRWAGKRKAPVDPQMNRIRIVEDAPDLESDQPPEPAGEGAALFDDIPDARLMRLGVWSEEIPAIRRIRTLEDLEETATERDATTHDILVGLAAGMNDEDILTSVGAEEPVDRSVERAAPELADVLESPESRQKIFIPDDEAELRRFFDGELEGWRVFLHPSQRKVAYRDYNGPAMVRGGAGTGKTVVAMHRAKYLADRIAQDRARQGERILLTTFTRNLASDIRANMQTLCPEHVGGPQPVIEIVNLDRWVSQFLKARDYPREIVFWQDNQLDDIWRASVDEHGLPDGLSEDFVRAEWAQIVQAKGIQTRNEYARISRAGRGTPLDRKKRMALWQLFEDVRSRMIDEGLAEPDDAYREAIALLEGRAANLPYSSVIVDETQDMGEQALKLVRAIVPQTPDGDRNSIFLVGDAHQRIYARRASLSACGINVRGRSRKLRLNYRTSDEIRRWAVSVMQGVPVDDLDDGVDDLSGYTSLLKGVAPEIRSFESETAELEGLVDWLRNASEISRETRNLAVLCATRGLRDRAATKLREAGLPVLTLTGGDPDDRNLEGVRVMTMHRAKGLEFESVAIPFLSDENFPPKGARSSAVDKADQTEIFERHRALLHVAATRAKKRLLVSWSINQSSLIPQTVADGGA